MDPYLGQYLDKKYPQALSLEDLLFGQFLDKRYPQPPSLKNLPGIFQFLDKKYLQPPLKDLQPLKNPFLAPLKDLQLAKDQCLQLPLKNPRFLQPPKDQFADNRYPQPHNLQVLQDILSQPPPLYPAYHNHLDYRGRRQNLRYRPYPAPRFGQDDLSLIIGRLSEENEVLKTTTGEHVAEDESDPKNKVVFEALPFSKGASRFAYRGKLYRSPEDKNPKEIVVKKFINKIARCKSDWALDIKSTKQASELAAGFNGVSGTDRPIKFREMILMKVTKSTPLCNVKVGEWVVVEEYLHGKYTKWLSNEGSVNSEIGLSLPAFAHWTWVKTGRKLVCDLQGVRGPSGYWLTDPAIHSLCREYGAPDRGEVGIREFFSTHKCNSFCKALGIETKLPGREKALCHWK